MDIEGFWPGTAGRLEALFVGQCRNMRTLYAKDSAVLASGSGCPLLTSYAPMPDDSNAGIQNPVAPKSAEIDPLNELVLDESSQSTAILSSSGQDTLTLGPHTRMLGLDCRERCIEGFFHFFHGSHPFLLPRRQALQMLRTRPISHLETAMCYIGSQYVSTESTGRFEFELETLTSRLDVSNDGFLVQSLLLFAIGLDGNNDQKRASSVLVRAQNLALRLGMHQLEYAKLNSGGSSVVEESWRRTWWELYIVDGIIAGLHQSSIFHLYGIASTVPLPCEEEDFKSGVSLADLVNCEIEANSCSTFLRLIQSTTLTSSLSTTKVFIGHRIHIE